MMSLKYCSVPVINSTLTLNGSNFQTIAVGYYTFWGAMDYQMAPGPFNMALLIAISQDKNDNGERF